MVTIETDHIGELPKLIVLANRWNYYACMYMQYVMETNRHWKSTRNQYFLDTSSVLYFLVAFSGFFLKGTSGRYN